LAAPQILSPFVGLACVQIPGGVILVAIWNWVIFLKECGIQIAFLLRKPI